MSTRKVAATALSALLAVACGEDNGSERPDEKPALPAETIAARVAFFGAENVNERGYVREDRVILSWFGVSSLAASFKGRVALLDTYINNGACPPASGAPAYVATDYAQVAALAAEAIFIGHGHFDHQCETGQLLQSGAASLVGLPVHCQKARDEAAPTPITCIEALPADSVFGNAASIQPLGDGVRVTAVRNLHSGADNQPPCNTGGCEAMLYRFDVGDFSLVWNDSNGPIASHAPELLSALRALAPSDVQFGAIIGNGFLVQGMRDPVDYAEALRVKELYPIHHDILGSGTSGGFRAGYEAAFADRFGAALTAHWLQDPEDYLRPVVFDPSDPRWRD